MSDSLYFSPSGMTTFLECREKYRLRYIEQVESAEPDIHLTFGRACHKIPECYWKGLPQEEAFNAALMVCGEIGPPMLLPSKLRDKWLSLMDGLMESVEAYYRWHQEDHCDGAGLHREAVHMLEQEFQYQLPSYTLNVGDFFVPDQLLKVFVTGRIDQYIGTTLRELKTASEVGANWKHDYRNYLLRNWGLQVYDWYLCQNFCGAEPRRAVREGEPGCVSNASSRVPDPSGDTGRDIRYAQDLPTPASTEMPTAPFHIEVEVLVKPYRDKRPRIELFDLTKEVVAYRERTAQQVEWICREMAEYTLKYSQVSPWPVSSSACNTKFGPCDYLYGCNSGHEKAAEKGLYKIRERVAK